MPTINFMFFKTILSALTLFFIGWGFNSLLLSPGTKKLPNKFKQYIYFLHYFSGSIFIIFWGMVLTLSKIGMVKSFRNASISGSIIIVLIATCLFFYAFLNKQLLPVSRQKTLNPLLAFMLILFFISRVLSHLPLVYEGRSDFFIEKSLIGELSSENLLSLKDYQSGIAVAIAFLSAFFQTSMRTATNFLLAFYISFLMPLFFIWFGERLTVLKRITVFGLILLFSFLWLSYFKSSEVLLKQIVFIETSILLLIFSKEYLSQAQKKLPVFTRHDLLIAVYWSTLASVWQEAFRISLPFFSFLACLATVNQKNWRPLYLLIKILFLAIIINPMTAGAALMLGAFR